MNYISLDKNELYMSVGERFNDYSNEYLDSLVYIQDYEKDHVFEVYFDNFKDAKKYFFQILETIESYNIINVLCNEYFSMFGKYPQIESYDSI